MTMSAEDALRYAKRVACRMMPRDCEAESLAGEAALRALRTYDPGRAVPMERWISICVRTDVWCYWRQRSRQSETFHDEQWWEENEPVAPEVDEVELPCQDWQILVETYIQRWPIDVVARERGISVYAARKLLRAAEARLERAIG